MFTAAPLRVKVRLGKPRCDSTAMEKSENE
jgi:hypothetical protein